MYLQLLDLKKCADILEKSKLSGEKCLVHCNAGVSHKIIINLYCIYVHNTIQLYEQNRVLPNTFIHTMQCIVYLYQFSYCIGEPSCNDCDWLSDPQRRFGLQESF